MATSARWLGIGERPSQADTTEKANLLYKIEKMEKRSREREERSHERIAAIERENTSLEAKVQQTYDNLKRFQ